MYVLHFQPHNIKLALDICYEERNKWGMRFRCESGSIIRVFEPEYVANRVLAIFNERNTK